MDVVFWYKDYFSISKYSEADGMYYGVIEGISDSISFNGGETEQEFESHFHEAVDDYLEMCCQLGKQPEVPKGDKNMQSSKRMYTILLTQKGVNELYDFITSHLECNNDKFEVERVMFDLEEYVDPEIWEDKK